MFVVYVYVGVYTAFVYFCVAETQGSGQCQAVLLIVPRLCEAERGPAASISAMPHFCSSAFSIALCILCLHEADTQPFLRGNVYPARLHMRVKSSVFFTELSETADSPSIAGNSAIFIRPGY